MGGTYLPISGVVMSDGSLAALQGLVSSPALVTPPGAPPPGSFTSTGVSVSSFQVSAQMMATAGFGSLVSFSTQAYTVYLIIDVMATLGVPSTNKTSPIATWYYGVGVRVALAGVNASGSAAGTMQGVAANATLNAKASAFQFDGIGVGFGVLPLLTGLVDSTIVGFDAGTVGQLAGVVVDITTYIANPANASQLTPQIIGVVFATQTQVQNAAASWPFALRGISQGTMLGQLPAAKDLPSGISIDPTLTTTMYNLLGVSSNTPPVPDSSQKAVANQLINSGP